MAIECLECHFDNPDDSLYCSKCGTKFQTPKEISAAPTKTLLTPIQDLGPGSTFAGRYQIIEELGEGGMGKVYKVIDKQIEETVSLKLIKPEIAADEKTIERFQNELKFARKVSHKNVCRMYHLSKERDAYYITMEYIPGEDLKSMIRMTRQLSVGTAVGIAKQVCEGLAEAHRLGVVHRDLKPGNIMIDKEGNARIMDFGIARSLKTKGMTGPGAIIGTPEYMSPEQADGREVDLLSDIYSLGVILYEMATGSVPFEGDTFLKVLLKQKKEMPQDPRQINPQVPDSLSRTILKCLEKKRETRYQSAEELLKDLDDIEKELPTIDSRILKEKPATSREITVTFTLKKLIVPALILIAVVILGVMGWKYFFKKTTSIPPEDMVEVAVISFENQTGDKAYDYLQAAIPNLLITSLEQSKYIRVTTWERMHDLLKQLGKEDVRLIDRDLGFEICRLDGVDAIVLGSFTKAEEMFATDVKVLDVETKSLLKSASSRGEGVDSILKRQIDELSSEISQGIGLPEPTTSADLSPIVEVITDSMEAYNYFLRGREDFEKFYLNDARRFLEKAVELDPEFAMAYYYLGRVYGGLGNITRMNKAFEKFKKYGKELKGKEELYVKAILARYIEKNNEKHLKILKEIVAKYPKEKRIHLDLANYYLFDGMISEGIEELNKAIALDPKFGPAINLIAYSYSELKDFDKALEYFRRYASVSPGDANPFDSMGEVYFNMGKLDEAIEKFKEALEVKPDFGSDWKIAYIYALRENYHEAMKWVDQFISEAPADTIKVRGYLWKGFYHHILGNIEQSLEAINRAEELARKTEDKGLIESTLWTKIWVCYDWGKTELYRRYFEIRMDFRNKNDMGSETLNTVYSCFYSGRMELKMGRIESAKSKLAEIQSLLSKIEPEDEERIKSAYNDFSSKVLLAEGSVDEAVSVFKKNLPPPLTFPRSGHATFISRNLSFDRDFFARAFQKKGETDKAIAEYERLVTFDPASMDRGLIHPFSRFRLAKLYEEKDLRVKAIEQYEKVLEIWKNADKGLLEVEDARKRLAALKSEGRKP